MIPTASGALVISGRSTLKAWRPGLIEFYLSRGYSLDEAIRAAARDDGLLYESMVHNLIVTAGLNLVANHMIASVTNGLVYHSIGTGTTVPAIGDTHLTTETARQPVTTKVRAGSTDTFDIFYSAAQSNYNIKEAGMWGGAATATLGSGTLFSHYLQSYDNVSNQSDLTWEYQLTVAAA